VPLDTNLLNPDNFFARLANLDDVALLDFVTSWHQRGETAEELTAFANYIFKQEARIEAGLEVYDCAGTGGDGANTFNISTTAAIIAAGTGLKVSKNGGRSTTSKSGSVDVLEALGFNLQAPYAKRLAGLEKHNLAFLASKVTGELLVRVKTLCRKEQVTGFISLLGPLTNPIKLKGQIIGIGQRRWLEPLTGALSSFIQAGNLNRACVLRSTSIRFDELSSCSDSELRFVYGSRSLDCSFSPEDISLKRSTMSELTGGDPKTNAAIIQGLLKGELDDKPKLETACLNAALLLLLDRDLEALFAGADFKQLMAKNYNLCQEAVTKGQAWTNFRDLLEFLAV
jgi:anthranilate phosphoribosyltransferase